MSETMNLNQNEVFTVKLTKDQSSPATPEQALGLILTVLGQIPQFQHLVGDLEIMGKDVLAVLTSPEGTELVNDTVTLFKRYDQVIRDSGVVESIITNENKLASWTRVIDHFVNEANKNTSPKIVISTIEE